MQAEIDRNLHSPKARPLTSGKDASKMGRRSVSPNKGLKASAREGSPNKNSSKGFYRHESTPYPERAESPKKTRKSRRHTGGSQRSSTASRSYSNNGSNENLQNGYNQQYMDDYQCGDSSYYHGPMEPLQSDGGQSNMSDTSFPYSTETLEKMLQKVTANNEGNVCLTLMERENVELKRKICCMQAQEKLEAEKLCREEQMLEARLNRYSEIQHQIQTDLDMYRNWSAEMEKKVKTEAEKVSKIRNQLEAVKSTYENARTHLYNLTVKLHDEIRYRTAGINKEAVTETRTLDLLLFKIKIPYQRTSKPISRPPRRSAGQPWLSDETWESFSPVLFMLLLFVASIAFGLIRFECKLSSEIGKPGGDKGGGDKGGGDKAGGDKGGGDKGGGDKGGGDKGGGDKGGGDKGGGDKGGGDKGDGDKGGGDKGGGDKDGGDKAGGDKAGGDKGGDKKGDKGGAKEDAGGAKGKAKASKAKMGRRR